MTKDPKCRRCCGTGVEPLTDAYTRTLALFSSADVELTAAGVAHYDACTPNAANNRLEKLRDRGLLTRTKDGRQWAYRLAVKGRKP